MNQELANLTLFLHTVAKVLVLTGLGLPLALYLLTLLRRSK